MTSYVLTAGPLVYGTLYTRLADAQAAAATLTRHPHGPVVINQLTPVQEH